MLQRILALIVKEFLAVWRDPKSRVTLLVPPLIQLVVFAEAATFEVSDVPIAVLNEDAGRTGRDVAARFEASPAFRTVRHLNHTEEIRPAIDAREVRAVLHFGQRFSAEAAADPPAVLQIVVDGRQSNTALILLGYAGQIVEAYNRERAETQGAAGPPARLVTRAWFNPNLESQWFIVPGLVAVLTLVVTLVVTGLSVARERELGTFEQLLVTPLRPAEIFVGKTVPALVIGLAEASFMIAAAMWWYEVPLRGSLALLYLGLLIYLLAAIGVGLMISSYAKTQQQAILGAFLFLSPAIILSGFATPISNMPEWLQVVTYANPVRYMLVIVRGLFLQDLPAGLIVDQLWPLALIALANGVIAVLLMRRRLG